MNRKREEFRDQFQQEFQALKQTNDDLMLKEDELTFFEEQMENNQEVDRGKFEEHAKKGQAAIKEADKDL